MNFRPVGVWRQRRVKGPASIVSMPVEFVLGFEVELVFDGEGVGEAWEAMACKEWKVEPILRQSLVFSGGEVGEKDVEYINPPDLFTMNRWRNVIVRLMLG
jgi:hypothetical protein